MSTLTKTLRPFGRGVAVLMLLGAFAPGGVMAAAPPATLNQTAAGTNITNTASVDYAVGGINQPDITSNTDDFEVDRRVDVFVTEVSGAEHDVSPGQSSFATGTALSFYVTNLGNDTQDIAVTAANQADGTDDDFGLTGTDLFDVTAPFLYYLDDGDDVYEGGGQDGALPTEAGQAYIDQLAKDTTARIWVVPTSIPTTAGDADATNGNFAVVSLLATVYTPGTGAADLGVAETETAGADTAGTVDVVFADADGEYDADQDGAHSEDDVYQIAAAVVSITKSSAVTSDPINGATNPKRIPGATIRYTITVANAASATASAEDVTITDIVPVNTSYVAGSIFQSTDTDCATAGDNAARTDAADADNSSFDGTDTLTFGNASTDVAANASVTFCYNVTID